MNGIKGKLRRFVYKLKHDFLTIENVALTFAIILCLTWTYQSIVSMSRNWELTDRLNAERKNLELIKVEVETAELENEYLASAEYQELAARKLLNKQLPGEKMVYLPDNSEAAKTKHQTTVSAPAEPEKNYTNFEQWMMYLFPKR